MVSSLFITIDYPSILNYVLINSSVPGRSSTMISQTPDLPSNPSVECCKSKKVPRMCLGYCSNTKKSSRVQKARNTMCTEFTPQMESCLSGTLTFYYQYL